jgi:hypothetical protein
MGHLQYNVQGAYELGDSVKGPGGNVYVPGLYTYSSLAGNSGELYMLQNDTAVISGKFYFQGVDTAGNIVSVLNGYFNVPKL